MLIKRSFLLFIFLIIFKVQAGVLLEPHLGYIISGKSDYVMASKNLTDSYGGLQFGGRVGYQLMGFMGGLSFAHANYSIDTACSNCSPNSDKTSFTQNAFGFFIGYNAPVLMRAWFAYHFSLKETVDKSANYFSEGQCRKGSSTEFGVGYSGLPVLSLNFVYRMLSYNTATTNNLGAITLFDSSPKEVVLQVSAPFDLF